MIERTQESCSLPSIVRSHTTVCGNPFHSSEMSSRSLDAADYSRFGFRINNASFDLRSCGCCGCSAWKREEKEALGRASSRSRGSAKRGRLPFILGGRGDSLANRMPQNVRNKWRFLYAIAVSKGPTMHPTCYYCYYSPVRSRSHFTLAHATRSINTRWVSYIVFLACSILPFLSSFIIFFYFYFFILFK